MLSMLHVGNETSAEPQDVTLTAEAEQGSR